MRPAFFFLLVLASACDRTTSVPPDSASAPAPVSASASASVSLSAPVSAPVSVSVSVSASAPVSVFDPADWEPATGHWTFDGGELVSDGRVMSSLIYRKGVRARDLDFSVDVRFEQNESSAGMVFREVGDDFYANASFYQFEWYTRGSHHDRRLSFMKKNPYWVQLVEPQYPEAPLGVWIRMRVRVEGDFVQTFVEDRPVFAKHDTSFVREGRVGLHCFMPRPVRFRRPVLLLW